MQTQPINNPVPSAFQPSNNGIVIDNQNIVENNSKQDENKYYLSEDSQNYISSLQQKINDNVKALDKRAKYTPYIRKMINMICTSKSIGQIFNNLILDTSFSDHYTARTINTNEFKNKITNINNIVYHLYQYVSKSINFDDTNQDFLKLINALKNVDVSVKNDKDKLQSFIDAYDEILSNYDYGIFTLSIYGVLYSKVVSLITKLNPYVQAIKFNLITRRKLVSRGHKYLNDNFTFKAGNVYDNFVPLNKKTKKSQKEKEYEKYASIMLPVNCLDECIIEARYFKEYSDGKSNWFTLLLRMSDFFGGSVSTWLTLFVPVVITTTIKNNVNVYTAYKCKYYVSPDGTVELIKTNLVYDIANLDDEVVKQLHYYDNNDKAIKLIYNSGSLFENLTAGEPTISQEEREKRNKAAKGMIDRISRTESYYDSKSEY